MEDFFVDNLMEIISTVIVIAVAIWIFFAQRKKKELSYDIISDTQLLGVGNDLQNKVKVLYEENEVSNVHLLTLRFINNGNQPIVEDDYARPITISINDEALILSYEIIDEEPDNLELELKQKGNILSLSPVLLNAKDAFSVKTLVGGFEGSPKVDGRIKGVKSIKRVSENKMLYPFITSLFFVVVGGGFLSNERQYDLFDITISSEAIGGGLFVFGYFSMIWVMFRKILKSKYLMQAYKRLWDEFRGTSRRTPPNS